MNINEYVAELRDNYRLDVKPFIEEKDYEVASIGMKSILDRMQARMEEIRDNVHMGPRYMASAKLLYRKLENSADTTLPLDKLVQSFETYQAQTQLPKEEFTSKTTDRMLRDLFK
jgi:hypothetical protein